MESVIALNSATACTSLSPSAAIWQDVLAQAMTGELIAAMNYTSLAEICDDPEEVADALEHADGERWHAAAFAAEGRKMGLDVPNNVNGKHWKKLREAFLRCIEGRDFIACLIVQEIMLESFAVASYGRVGKVAPGSLGKRTCRSRHVDSSSRASPGRAALRRQGVPAASGCDDHPGGDAHQRMQEWTLRSMPRQLR
jgi:hypothetical protein